MRLSQFHSFHPLTKISYTQKYMQPNQDFIISQVSFPASLPLEPQRAMISGLLLLSSSLRQALPARSLMTDSSLKMRACWQTNTKLNNLGRWQENMKVKPHRQKLCFLSMFGAFWNSFASVDTVKKNSIHTDWEVHVNTRHLMHFSFLMHIVKHKFHVEPLMSPLFLCNIYNYHFEFHTRTVLAY